MLWDAENQRMLTYEVNQRAALRLLLHWLDLDIEAILKTYTVGRLRSELAGIFNRLPDEIQLPTPLQRILITLVPLN